MISRNTFTAASILGSVLLLLLGLVVFWPRQELSSAPTADDAPAARLVCYGYIDTRQAPLFLLPARAGRIVKVFVKEAQVVAKDAPLVQLDDSLVALRERQAELAVDAADLQLAKAESGVAQYEAKRAQAEAALEAANNKVAAAQFALDRKQELVDKEFLNRVESQVAQAQLNEARALVKAEQNRLMELAAFHPDTEVKLARLEQNRSRTQLEEARQERKEYLLRAPVDGQVLRVQVEQGDLVGPSSPRPALLLAPKGPWIVRAEVSQEFASLVEQGAVAEVEDESSLDVLAKGIVSETSGVFLPRRQLSDLPNAVITGVSMECVIELQKGHQPLRVGQRVRVRILDDPPAGE